MAILKIIIIGAVLFLPWLVAGKRWILEANVDEVVVGSSQNIQLTCRHNSLSRALVPQTPQQGQSHIENFAKLLKVRIVKLDPFGNKMKFAEIRVQSNITSQSIGNFSVTSNVDEDDENFLRVKWQIATMNTAGAYGCQVSGLDTDDNYFQFDTKPVLIKENVITLREMTRSLQSLASQFEERQQSMASEIEKLQRKIHSMEEEYHFNQANITAEMNLLKVDIDCDATPLNKKNSSNLHYNDRLKTLSNIFQNQIDLCLANVSMLSTSQKDFKDFIMDAVARTERTINVTKFRLFAQLSNLSSEIGIFKNKFEVIDSLKCHREKNFPASTATPTTSSTTISTTSTSTTMTSQASSLAITSTSTSISPTLKPNVWPNGFYCLPKGPGSDCPNKEQSNQTGMFRAIPYDSNLQDVSENHPIPAHDLFSITISSAIIECCLKLEGYPNNYIDWPAGSYCIESYDNKCPRNFEKDSFLISAHKGHWQRYKGYFCCRWDGSEITPMTLPASSPFYLYKNAQECPKVHNMQASVDKMLIWPKPGVKLTIQMHNVTKRVLAVEILHQLCYYQPSVGG